MAHILVMEDNPEHAAMIVEILESVGHKTLVCADGSSAWEELQRGRYDLLIVDIYVKKDGAFLPDGGVTLLGRVRSPTNRVAEHLRWMVEVPIIAISGGQVIPGGFDPLRQARDLGADALLRKPIKLSDMLEAVAELLRGEVPADRL